MPDVYTLPAGREMDALVAVMLGCHPEPFDELFSGQVSYACRCNGGAHGDILGVRRYSTDPGSAFLVLDELRNTGHTYHVYGGLHDFAVEIRRGLVEHLAETRDRSLPLAICRAALIAVAVK